MQSVKLFIVYALKEGIFSIAFRVILLVTYPAILAIAVFYHLQVRSLWPEEWWELAWCGVAAIILGILSIVGERVIRWPVLS